VRRKNGNTRMAKPRLAARGIVVRIAGTVIRLRRKRKGTAKLFVKKQSRCALMEQA
jgi:hypothetical protein